MKYVALVLALSLGGCATSLTPAGATTAQKLQDDITVLKAVETDVVNGCGAKFAPIATLAAAILSVAVDAAASNYVGAVEAAAAAIPAIAADGQAIACVVGVVKADWAKYKPAK